VSKGAWIHDDVDRHFKACPQCRQLEPEKERVASPGRRDVSAGTLAAMCPDGRSIYRSYLRWLAEPDW
jgi:hypothetical protein